MLSSKDIIFTSYCFGNSAAQGDYKPQQDRLRKTILDIYPDANTHFVYESEETGKPKFQKSLYGFKVNIIKECLAMGYKKIVYLDAAVTLVDRIDHWFDVIKDYGVLSIKDNHKLTGVTSIAVQKYAGLSDEDLENINLLGGSIYVFDFDLQLCNDIFNYWSELEQNGYFGTQDDLSNNRLQGHRMDETCMAIALHKSGVKSLGYDVMRYGYLHPESGKIVKSTIDQPLIALKRHFK